MLEVKILEVVVLVQHQEVGVVLEWKLSGGRGDGESRVIFLEPRFSLQITAPHVALIYASSALC